MKTSIEPSECHIEVKSLNGNFSISGTFRADSMPDHMHKNNWLIFDPNEWQERKGILLPNDPISITITEFDGQSNQFHAIHTETRNMDAPYLRGGPDTQFMKIHFTALI